MLNIYVAKTLSNFEEYNEQQIDYQKIRQETYRMVDYITGLVSEKEYKVDEYMKIDNMEDIRNFNSQIRNVVKEEYKETENEK
jgi:flagella basal body P-ring formation protein FlgA